MFLLLHLPTPTRHLSVWHGVKGAEGTCILQSFGKYPLIEHEYDAIVV